MLFWLLAFLTFRSVPAQAFDRTEYKLIDLRAVSISGGLSNYRLEKQARTRNQSLPQGLQGPVMPAGQPVYDPSGYGYGYVPQPTGFVPQPSYAMQSYPAPAPQASYAPQPVPGPSAVPSPVQTGTLPSSAQTADIESYIKANPQVIPDV